MKTRTIALMKVTKPQMSWTQWLWISIVPVLVLCLWSINYELSLLEYAGYSILIHVSLKRTPFTIACDLFHVLGYFLGGSFFLSALF